MEEGDDVHLLSEEIPNTIPSPGFPKGSLGIRRSEVLKFPDTMLQDAITSESNIDLGHVFFCQLVFTIVARRCNME